MGKTHVEVKGLDELLRRFDGSNKVLKRETQDAMDKSVKVVHKDAASYSQHEPPQAPGQTYVRTFTMARTMSSEVKQYRGGVRGYIRGGVHYAARVRGEEQAPAFEGRWRKLSTIAKQHLEEIEGFFKEALGNVAKHLGD